MYVLNMLLYPFIDLSELGQIYSVSVDEILDNNKMEVEMSVQNKYEISIKNFSEKYLHYINSLSLSQKVNLNKISNKEIFSLICK